MKICNLPFAKGIINTMATNADPSNILVVGGWEIKIRDSVKINVGPATVAFAKLKR